MQSAGAAKAQLHVPVRVSALNWPIKELQRVHNAVGVSLRDCQIVPWLPWVCSVHPSQGDKGAVCELAVRLAMIFWPFLGVAVICSKTVEIYGTRGFGAKYVCAPFWTKYTCLFYSLQWHLLSTSCTDRLVSSLVGCLQISVCLLPATESLVHGSAITQTALGLSFQTVVKCRWMPATIWRWTQVLGREDLQRAWRVQMQVCRVHPCEVSAKSLKPSATLCLEVRQNCATSEARWRRLLTYFDALKKNLTHQPRDTHLNWSSSGADQTRILCRSCLRSFLSWRQWRTAANPPGGAAGIGCNRTVREHGLAALSKWQGWAAPTPWASLWEQRKCFLLLGRPRRWSSLDSARQGWDSCAVTADTFNACNEEKLWSPALSLKGVFAELCLLQNNYNCKLGMGVC